MCSYYSSSLRAAATCWGVGSCWGWRRGDLTLEGPRWHSCITNGWNWAQLPPLQLLSGVSIQHGDAWALTAVAN